MQHQHRFALGGEADFVCNECQWPEWAVPLISFTATIFSLTFVWNPSFSLITWHSSCVTSLLAPLLSFHHNCDYYWPLWTTNLNKLIEKTRVVYQSVNCQICMSHPAPLVVWLPALATKYVLRLGRAHLRYPQNAQKSICRAFWINFVQFRLTRAVCFL